MPKIEAVVFDIDGTLLDTKEFASQAFEYVLKHHGMPQRSREDIWRQMGKKLEDCYAFLAPNGNHAKMADDHTSFQEATLSLVKAFDYVEYILGRLRSKGIKIALWTGRNNGVIPSLEAAQVEPDAFDCIVDASMYEKGKPDPEGLFMVLDKLGVKPEKSVMVGDAGFDMEAGRRAGVAATVGLTHGYGTRKELRAAKADYILDSLESLPSVIEAIG